MVILSTRTVPLLWVSATNMRVMGCDPCPKNLTLRAQWYGLMLHCGVLNLMKLPGFALRECWFNMEFSAFRFDVVSILLISIFRYVEYR